MLKTALSITSLGIISNLFGFLWSMTLAYYFGASAEMDAFVVSLNFVIILSAIFLKVQNNAFIPLLSDYADRTEKSAAISNIFRFSLLFFLFVSILVFLFSRPIVFLLAPGLQVESTELATNLLRILSPFLFLSSFIGLANGLLEHNDKFLVSAWIKLSRPAMALLFLIILVSHHGIYAVSTAHVLSFVGTAAISLFVFTRSGYFFRWSAGIDFSTIKKYLVILMPLMLGSVIWETVHFADTFVASFLPGGSISYLSYALKLTGITVLMVASINTILFPSLARQNRVENNPEFLRIFAKGFQATVYVLLPVTVLFFVLAEPISFILFKRGQFSEQDSQIVGETIRCYFYVLLGGPIGGYINYAYYSRKKNMLTVRYSSITAVVNITLNLILSQWLAHYGIAIASSIAILFGNILFLNRLKKVLPEFRARHFLAPVAPMIACAASTGFLVAVLNHFVTFNFDNPYLNKVVEVLVFSVVGFICYYVVSRLLKVKILKSLGLG